MKQSLLRIRKRAVTALLGLVLAGAAHAQSFAPPEHTAKAIFAGGCFWCLQAEFEQAAGILSVTAGYTGGQVENPTYEQVSGHATGHAEAIALVYDPDKINYDQLLEIYWSNIDPTDEGGQFYDRGSQYRTVIYYLDEEQRQKAEASKERIAEKLKQPVKTEILPAAAFYKAETYHQDFYKKNPLRYNAYKYGSGREERLKALWNK